MKLSQTKIGDKVIVYRDPSITDGTQLARQKKSGLLKIEAYVLNSYKEGYCFRIGLADIIKITKSNFIGWDSTPDSGILDEIKNIKDIPNIKYAWDIFNPSKIYCEYLINYPDQKCFKCNISSPHSEPNNDKLYICNFCAFFERNNLK